MLLGLAVFVPLLWPATTSLTWTPTWLAAAISGAALFGALLLFWRAGALRARYLVLLAIGIAIAAVVGALSR